MLRLLFNREAVALLVELSHAIALRVVYPIAEDGCLLLFFCCAYSLLQHLGEAYALEDVIAKNQTDAIVADEVFAYGESLSKSIWRWLLSILEVHSVVGAVAQQALEARQVKRCGDDEYLTDTSQHQY